MKSDCFFLGSLLSRVRLSPPAVIDSPLERVVRDEAADVAAAAVVVPDGFAPEEREGFPLFRMKKRPS